MQHNLSSLGVGWRRKIKNPTNGGGDLEGGFEEDPAAKNQGSRGRTTKGSSVGRDLESHLVQPRRTAISKPSLTNA